MEPGADYRGFKKEATRRGSAHTMPPGRKTYRVSYHPLRLNRRQNTLLTRATQSQCIFVTVACHVMDVHSQTRL